MRRDGTFQRGWKRERKNGASDPSHIFRELQRREMRDLETCRRVWEAEGDPLALCEAVRQSNLPEWLTHSLLFVLTDGTRTKSFMPRRWRDRTRDAGDAELAAQMAMIRSHPDRPEDPASWELTFPMAIEFTRERYPDLAKGQRRDDGLSGPTDSAMKRIYQRVSRSISQPWRYYRARPGMQEQVRAALAYMVGVIEANLEQSPKK